ncbi:M20 family metallopeptidase [Actinotalea sp. BY-33]|uniref:M20 family metallopeptidase n=1 Tax=Actinotalea soli TaxID=2819234 RepID=A0A939LPC9_9CELL|nr:M20 family metallopeptidase [Actinotalea soli]MBO1751801.1 M20 family metallopeptidase [Actinotalea soli]
MTSPYLAAAQRRFDELLAEVLRLVDHESPSHEPAAVARSAELVAEVGTRLLGRAPATLNREGGHHLLWRLGSGPRRVLLLGHHDTVWPLGTLERLPTSVTDGVLRGPGCLDMKTGVVQALMACGLVGVALGPQALDGVTILVTSDEETGSATSRAVIEAEAQGCAAVLVLEAAGPGGALKTARKGVSLYRVEVTGLAAHAGLEPEKGVNAGVELARQIPRIAALSDHALGTTVTPTSGSIGTATNTVPAHARVAVDVRAVTAVEQQRVHREIRALGPRTPGARVTVTGGINRPPMEEATSRELLATAQRVARELGARPVAGVAVGGASDGNITAGLGIPTLDGLGAVGDGAHADHEHVDLSYVAERTALLAGLIENLTG